MPKAPKAPRELSYLKCQRCRLDKAKVVIISTLNALALQHERGAHYQPVPARKSGMARTSLLEVERFDYPCSESRTKAQESALHHPSEESKSSGTATPFSERTDGDLMTACADLTWLRIYDDEYRSLDDYHHEEMRDLHEAMRGEIRLRLSGYVAKGNLQDALYMYEALRRMDTICYGPFQSFSGYDLQLDVLTLSTISELADLHLRRETFFQAELVLEESLRFQEQFIEPFSLDKENLELAMCSMIDLYKKFKARILADYPDCPADEMILRRVSRIDNLRLWKGLSLAGLIPPLNHKGLERAKQLKAPKLVQRILGREDDHVQDRSDSDEISLRTAPGGDSATLSDVVANPLDSGLPLHKVVIRNSWLELLRLLDKGKVYIDPRDKHNHTPLILAVCLRRVEMVRILFRRGANINAMDTIRNTIFDLADQKMSQILLHEMSHRLHVEALGRRMSPVKRFRQIQME